MEDPSGKSLKKLLVAALVSNAVLVAVVVTMGLRVERSIEALAASAQTASSASVGAALAERLPVRRVQASATASASPISAEQFQVQWEGHYAATAEAQCWQPYFTSYAKLPGHLDLQLDVSPDGGAERFELLGYKNPGDAPDPALVKAVFECVTSLLRPAHFPATGSPYSVRGRVNRPNPPPGFGAGPGSAPPLPGAASARAPR